MNNPSIQIQAPKFELYELVTVNWNEQEQTVKVVRRWLDFEDEQWWYKIEGSERLYPESAFTVRIEN